MRTEPENDSVAIVLVGHFNPAIFQPQWFGHHGLVSPEEADDAHIEIIHPEVSKFQVALFEFSVEKNRLVAGLSSPPFVTVADLIERAFGEFLPHTPIALMGINRHVHIDVESEYARNEIGKRLAPHESWGDWRHALERPIPNRGGLRSLTMEERGLDDRPDGHFQVKVEPSLKIKDNRGIYVSTNDHFQIGEPENVEGCGEILDLLHNRFEASMDRAERMVDQIISLKP